MISINELKYVNMWVSKCPYPGIDYATLATDKLKQALEDFKNYYLNKKYSLFLSNGEQLDFEILEKNLCHMLGVDYKNLSGDYFKDFRINILGTNASLKSYELLNLLVDKIDKVLEYDEYHGGKVLNYYRIMIKNSIFEKLSDFGQFNFSVLNFDKNKYTKYASFSSNKFLCVQSNEIISPYFMMGILQEMKDNSNEDEYDEINLKPYTVETLFAPTNANEFFKDQEVVIPTQIEINSGDKLIKKIATSKEKLALLNQYKLLINQYGLPNKLNISGDYEAILAEDCSRRLVK